MGLEPTLECEGPECRPYGVPDPEKADEGEEAKGSDEAKEAEGPEE